MHTHSFTVRRATGADAEAISEIIAGIAGERVHSAITDAWSADQQKSYLDHLSEREAIHLAESGDVVGYQVLERWAPTLPSMEHVGQIGTFIRPEWRGRGVGVALFQATAQFARAHAYDKFVIQVRASNMAAQRFYARLGFAECGRWKRQVRIGGEEDDEILMEMFL